MATRPRKVAKPPEAPDLIAAAFDQGNGPPPEDDPTAQDIADAMNDDHLQDSPDDDDPSLDADPIEDEGRQPPLDHRDDAEPRVRGRVVDFGEAPLLRMSRVNSQIPSINVYKETIDGVMVQVGQAPIRIGLQGFLRRFYAHMPRPGEPPAKMLARGCNAMGQEVSQEEYLPLLDAEHTYLQELRAAGFGKAPGVAGLSGVPGVSTVQDLVNLVDHATKGERERLTAEHAAVEATRKEAAAERDKQQAATGQLQQSVVRMALDNAKEQTAAAQIQANAQVAAVKETSQSATAMATSAANSVVELYKADAEKARSEAAASVERAKIEANERMHASDKKHESELARIKADSEFATLRMRTESDERIARMKADTEVRIAEAKALADLRTATLGINAQSPANMLTMAKEFLASMGTDPATALKNITGGGDAEMVVPIVEQLGKTLEAVATGFATAAGTYMQEQTKREELKAKERAAERAEARGWSPITVPFSNPAVPQLTMNPQVQVPNPQNQPQPILQATQPLSTGGPVAGTMPGIPVAPPPASSPPGGPIVPVVSALSLDKQREARMTAASVVDSLRALPRERWVGMVADMLGRVPALAALMREQTIAAVLKAAGAQPPMVQALLQDLQTPSGALVPIDIPRGSP